jgi:hypothetical protein
MKKKEMIEILLQEERRLWDEMMECIDKLGMHDPITDMQIARWSSINNLKIKLQIK